MTDLREQEMQNRIDALANEKRNLKEENQYLKEQIADLQTLRISAHIYGQGEGPHVSQVYPGDYQGHRLLPGNLPVPGVPETEPFLD